MKVQHLTYLQITFFGSFFVNSLHCVAKDANHFENQSQPRSPPGTSSSFVPYYPPNPTNAYPTTHAVQESVGKLPPKESSSGQLHYSPCSFVPSRTSGFQGLKNFSLTRGFYECENICQILYGGLKFAICLPVLNCRCLTKGLFQLTNWWHDVREDPTASPLVITYQLSKNFK